ncbi:glycoside hydrolase family 15 protein [Salinibacterium sp. NK8237]|uniref:glycoside hydrolase family 15 protein n=1 Tax=Salinibacterium sp. NK8237 TaxID=2792038 RepID=UPI0018CEF8B2|nr:glycoside hydrolase family 15 protein [Salinibacterium sp. NK8237]MBH0129250.1 glycoside hydrolase family 15 protein [Salinibacterium sp. NK8237]
MALPIEDYALIGDCQTAALIGKDGSIDWLCFPRFDSASMFGALLGNEDHGRWLVAPRASVDAPATVTTTRKYQDNTFILVTNWVTEDGEVEVTDFMPHGNRRADVIRRVRGISGSVEMYAELLIRFGYATALPWLHQAPEAGGNAIIGVAGPDAIVARGVEMHSADHTHRGEFTVSAGEVRDLTMTWYPAHRNPPSEVDVDSLLNSTRQWWLNWSDHCEPTEQYREIVKRSLLVLRVLTHEDTGGIVAAATTSLPEWFGGTRNWDYRYVWLRDAALTLHVLLDHGYVAEAEAWRRWLLRAIAGDPADVQIMYGLSGERWLEERELTSLPGYEGASPVRVGNGAFDQFQGDVFGEVMVALQAARRSGVHENDFSWPLQRALMSHVEDNWSRPDNGIWEIRGPERHFTHSRVMLWAAMDCAITAVEEFGLEGPIETWKEIREEIHQEIERDGWDAERGTYTQYYGGTGVDASLLQLPQVGYIAADDPRMLGTVAAIEEELLSDGLVLRYLTESGVDGLPDGENPFLTCSFWLVEQYASSGRMDDATTLMDRLVGFANDVGLLSEEYDTVNNRQAGNTPQALSHLALVRAADAISEAKTPR